MNLTEQSLSSIIRERHSVRKYDPNHKISESEIKSMLEEAILAPSSSNLQPWKFMVIQDQQKKIELREIAYNQEQVETSSAVIAVLGDKEMYRNAEKVLRTAYERGLIDEGTMQRAIEGSTKGYSSMPEERRTNIATFDTGLISMQIMLIAKSRGFDTVAMGGFDSKKFTEHFNLSDRYFPAVLIALGKAAGPARETVRLPIEDVVEFI